MTSYILLNLHMPEKMAHVVLTAEADSLPTCTRQLPEDSGLVGCHSIRDNGLSVRARIDSTGYVRLLWESIGDENEFSNAVIFEVKCGQKSERVITDSRGRRADALVVNLESVELASEGSDLNITENNFVPTARCIQDTKKRQLMTRSSLQRRRCCVCHLHHEQAMKALIVFDSFWRKKIQEGTTLQG